jgi:hypothetical protein
MKRLNLLIVAVALAVPALANAGTNKGIEGSVHDFSNVTNNTWNTRSGVCSPCHAAHHTDPAQLVPLWVHATSTANFTMYDSPTMDATVGTTPTGASLACLSCHDGTVAINASIGNPAPTNGVFIDAGAQIGPDLHTTHPISFTYDAALAALDGGLENPTTYKIGDTKSVLTVNNAPVPATGWSGTTLSGKTIQNALLINNQMQCSSCHDVHKLVGSAPSSGILIKISGNDVNGRGSLICRTCHIK